MTNRVIHVVGVALVAVGPKVLVARRSVRMRTPLKWEFPGGKVEPGERPEQALKREIQEELGCSIDVGEQVGVGVFVEADTTIELTVFWGRVNHGRPHAAEHDQLLWADSAMLLTLDWAPADVPIVGLVIEGLNNRGASQ